MSPTSLTPDVTLDATDDGLLCTDCRTVTAWLPLPAEQGFDAGERMCAVCGQARWSPGDPSDASQSAAA